MWGHRLDTASVSLGAAVEQGSLKVSSAEADLHGSFAGLRPDLRGARAPHEEPPNASDAQSGSPSDGAEGRGGEAVVLACPQGASPDDGGSV